MNIMMALDIPTISPERIFDLGARIFTVADHYDALISDRPYREGLPRETVIGFIKEDSGTKFDPKVVEAFLEVMAQEEREAVSS